MKSIIHFIILSLAFVTVGYAQNDKQDPVKQAIDSKQYVFKARTVMPASGSSRQLTSEYNLTVNQDSIVAFLPYFGRAYVAPIGKTTDGINFTSTDFSYKVDETKNGGWMIGIRTKDAGDVQQVNLNLSKNGYGTLHINSQNRQSISYTGKIEPLTKSK